MTQKSIRALLITAGLAAASLTIAADDPRLERHELMEDVGDAAKPVGAMLKGERDYEWSVVENSLKTFEKVSMRFGDLFPAGSETGEGTEAAPAIWDDRGGFEEALADWRTATIEALAAEPETLDAAKPFLGAVFNQCKNCHDGYRIED
jgi:cytochrome c556